MAQEIDFKALSAHLLNHARELIPAWFPFGKLRGHEWVIGNICGALGDSLSINLDSGMWADFADPNLKGGDLISLFAAIHKISQGDAARQLAEQLGYDLGIDKSTLPDKPAQAIFKPPIGVNPPDMYHPKFGDCSKYWIYRYPNRDIWWYLARYDLPDSRKEFFPFTWDGQKWVAKALLAPRPLYNLDLLANNPKRPCLVTEGEKATDAAWWLVGPHLIAVTWPGGANAVRKIDWSPIYGRHVLLWPDADEPGRKAMNEIAAIIHPHCKEVKIIDTKDMPDGWDAADAVRDGFKWEKFVEWARPLVSLFDPANIKVVAIAKSKDGKALAAAQANIQVNVPDPEDPGNVSKSSFAIWNDVGLALTTKGAPICNMDNVKRIFERMSRFRDFVWYDEFYERIFTLWKSEKPREFTDQDIINIMGFIQRELGLSRITKENVFQAIVDYAYERKKNAPKDWFETLKWDEIDRIEHFFIDCVGAEDNEFTRAVGHNFWIAMVARIYEPGCKFDHLVYLQGPQDIGKSTAWEEIGGDWHTSASYQLTDRDFLLSLKGKLVVELSELTSVKRADVNAIKEIISRRVDNYQIRYERMTKDHPRRCVFCGTTNEDLVIPDNTGARRFWPIKCNGLVRNDLIRQNRPQYFAEAVTRYKRGEPWWKVPPELTKSIQAELRSDDAWESPIQQHLLLTNKSEVTSNQIAIECLKLTVCDIDQTAKNRIANVMKFLGWENKGTWSKEEGRTVRVWRKKRIP